MFDDSFHFRFGRFFSLSSLAAAVCVAGCGGGGGDPGPPLTTADGRPVVFASVAPIAGLVERLAGGKVEVRTLAGAGQDPHGFSPTPKQVVELSRSWAFFVVGVPFEAPLLEKIDDSAARLSIVNVAAGLDLLANAEEEEDHDAHAEDDHHDHHHHGEAGDPHIWLSPPLLKTEAKTIVAALSRIAPEHAAVFGENLARFEAETDALHAELTAKLAPHRGQRFYVFHGAFAYFARAYGLEQAAIEIAGRGPEPKRLFAIVERAKADGVKIVFVQPQFDQKSARTLAESIGGSVVAIDPMEKDVLENLRHLADSIGGALKNP
ncbi:MAG: zinc ABC transporter substrate-binding protein [Verrucomicrobiae bacterium]|nr:zinc ABC transporter substrate-binding protein [Verrucomicrobiae bacterium]MCP5540146.1 zinc ABC transporter substrate-binding protein [Akkermansiaceae bacterium]